MDWYSIFYWITVADGVKQFLDITSNWFLGFTIVTFVGYIISHVAVAQETNAPNADGVTYKSDDYMIANAWKKWMGGLFYPFLILTFITWAGYVFIPSKKDALIIVAGGAVGNFVTQDSSAKKIPSEVMLMLRAKIKEETKGMSITDLVKGEVKDTLANKTAEELKEIIRNKQ